METAEVDFAALFPPFPPSLDILVVAGSNLGRSPFTLL
jgi:hypothetical protein